MSIPLVGKLRIATRLSLRLLNIPALTSANWQSVFSDNLTQLCVRFLSLSISLCNRLFFWTFRLGFDCHYRLQLVFMHDPEVGPTSQPPTSLNPTDRLAELGELLAAGLMRLHARKSSRLSDDRGDSSVDFLPNQSGHAAAPTRRTA